MSDYINREAAIKDFETNNARNPYWTPPRVKTLLLRQPAADVAPVVHGKWASEAIGGVYGPVCSVCGYYIPVISFWNAPYCPHCGAQMGGVAE